MSGVEFDYMRPIRDAAVEVASLVHQTKPDAPVVYSALIDFAGAILDAVRVEAAEAMRARNLEAIKHEMRADR